MKCAWPGCNMVTESWVEEGWCVYGDGDPTDGLIEGMPADGYLCLHHKEALDALDEGDFERFELLASI